MREVADVYMKYDKDALVKLINGRFTNLKCPLCANGNFMIADGYFRHQMSDEVSAGLMLGGPAIPTVAIICSKCGYVAELAAGVLGLMDGEPKV